MPTKKGHKAALSANHERITQTTIIMEKEKIIKDAAQRLGIERSLHLLTECSIDMASALLQREGVMNEENPDSELIYGLELTIYGRIADLLIAIDIACAHHGREDVRAEIQKRMVRLDVQNLSSQLP